MNIKKAYCPECRKESNYSVERKKLNGTIKALDISYDGEVAYCDNCGSEIFIPEIHDTNLEALNEQYRNQNALISPQQITEILENYDIGKRPLSVLLGWGEQTVSRYINGDIPSKQYSDILLKVYDNPEFYFSILEENKENLSSQLTYSKSLIAVQNILGVGYNDFSNLNRIVRYVLNKCQDITPLMLQKALYYIQGFYYAFYGEFLIDEDCEAWVHGPVFRNVYRRYSNYRFDKIDKVESIDDSVFTDMEKILIDSVIKYVCCYSGKILESFTHLEEPWILARKGLSIRESSNEIINRDNIGKYFTKIKERYEMLNPTDIKNYTSELFSKVSV